MNNEITHQDLQKILTPKTINRYDDIQKFIIDFFNSRLAPKGNEITRYQNCKAHSKFTALEITEMHFFDSFARLICSEDVCIAISLHNNKLLIASNKNQYTDDSTLPSIMHNANNILLYISNIAKISQTLKKSIWIEESLDKIFHYSESLNENLSAMLMMQFSREKIQESQENREDFKYSLMNNLRIDLQANIWGKNSEAFLHQQSLKNYAKELLRKFFIIKNNYFANSNEIIDLLQEDIVKNPPPNIKNVKNIIDIAKRFFNDLSILETFVSRNYSQELVSILSNKPIVNFVNNDGEIIPQISSLFQKKFYNAERSTTDLQICTKHIADVHAEMKIYLYQLKNGSSRSFIGISKPTCSFCNKILENEVNTNKLFKTELVSSCSHGKAYKIKLNEVMRKEDFIIKLLGEELYGVYKNLKKQNIELKTQTEPNVIDKGDLVLDLITHLPDIKKSLKFMKQFNIPDGFNSNDNEDLEIKYYISNFLIKDLEYNNYQLSGDYYCKVCTILSHE